MAEARGGGGGGGVISGEVADRNGPGGPLGPPGPFRSAMNLRQQSVLTEERDEARALYKLVGEQNEVLAQQNSLLKTQLDRMKSALENATAEAAVTKQWREQAEQQSGLRGEAENVIQKFYVVLVWMNMFYVLICTVWERNTVTNTYAQTNRPLVLDRVAC